jgi:hypothetical protein
MLLRKAVQIKPKALRWDSVGSFRRVPVTRLRFRRSAHADGASDATWRAWVMIQMIVAVALR